MPCHAYVRKVGVLGTDDLATCKRRKIQNVVLTFLDVINNFVAITWSLKVKLQVIRFIIVFSPWESFFLWAFSLGGQIVGIQIVVAINPNVMAAQRIMLCHGCFEGCAFGITALVPGGGV